MNNNIIDDEGQGGGDGDGEGKGEGEGDKNKNNKTKMTTNSEKNNNNNKIIREKIRNLNWRVTMQTSRITGGKMTESINLPTKTAK